MGTTFQSDHFNKQCSVREFSAVDAEFLIEQGEIMGGPIFDPEHQSWEYEFYGRVDGKGWYLVAALDCRSDLVACPRVILVTVHRLPRKKASKKREKNKRC